MAVNQTAALKDLAFSHTSNTCPPCLCDCSSQPLLTIPEEYHILGYGVLLGSYAAQNIVTSDCQLRSQNGAPLAGTGLLVTSENINGNRAICEFFQSSKISEATGMMLHYINGNLVTGDASFGSNVIHVNSSCIEWAPQVYFVGDNVKNLKPKLPRVQSESAEDFLVLCPAHSSVKFPSEKSRKAHFAAKFPNEKLGNYLSADDKVPTESGQLKSKTFWGQPENKKDWVFCGYALSPEEKVRLDETYFSVE
ncbi:hypothetical protein GOBAR_AA20509 [Gossypium barbadense]|uniref:Uncharacterized protein n=1 Tax=Gossypium barbadense TaxID=3634 RepID=A0A2P5X9Z4_GOSBA|nr:hypothetical protein GOBAR_AA20509 [Gossypium barbadense]